MSERVADGRCFRILTVVDQFTRECLCLVADQSLTGENVAQALEPVVMQRGAPRAITVDNGSKFASRVMDAWAYRHGIQLIFFGPANRLRTASSRASMDGYGMNASTWKCFLMIENVRQKLARWQQDYNRGRPHSALAGRVPAAFVAEWVAADHTD